MRPDGRGARSGLDHGADIVRRSGQRFTKGTSKMSDTKKESGELSVTLKTGFTRGGKTYVAGKVVKMGPGLAQRLVDRGQAVFTAADAKRIKAKTAAAVTAADDIAKGKKPDAIDAAAGGEPSS